MKTFFDWIKDKDNFLNEGNARYGKELIELLKKADWRDGSGDIAEFDSWEDGSSENKVYIIHPKVGRFMITVSRASRLPAKLIFKSVMRDYRNKVEELKILQAKRKAV
jgi:hypothetical protein